MVRRVTDVDAKMAAVIGRHFCHNLLKPARNPGTERCSTDLEKGIQISAEFSLTGKTVDPADSSLEVVLVILGNIGPRSTVIDRLGF